MISKLQHTLFASHAWSWLVVTAVQLEAGLVSFRALRLLVAGEPAELAALVMHLRQDCGLRLQPAENAQHPVEEHHSWSEIGLRFVDLVEDRARRLCSHRTSAT